MPYRPRPSPHPESGALSGARSVHARGGDPTTKGSGPKLTIPTGGSQLAAPCASCSEGRGTVGLSKKQKFIKKKKPHNREGEPRGFFSTVGQCIVGLFLD